MIPHRKKRTYSQELLNTVNGKTLGELEQKRYNILFNSIIEDTGIYKTEDMMLLDVACFDYIRIKRLQRMVAEKGDIHFHNVKGVEYPKAKEFSYLLNSINSSFRTTMRELMLTRKERTKKEIGKDTQDFANFIEQHTVEAEVLENGRSEVTDSKRPTTKRNNSSKKVRQQNNNNKKD